MSSFKVLFVCCCALILCGCSLLDPFVDRRREAGEKDLTKLYVGESTPQNPAICYNYFTANDDEIQQLADKECQKQKTGNKAIFEKETYFSCRLLLPNHVYFKCVFEDENEKGKE